MSRSVLSVALCVLAIALTAQAACDDSVALWESCSECQDCCDEGTCYEANRWYAQCRTSCDMPNWSCRDLTRDPRTVLEPPASCEDTTPEWGDCRAAPDCCARRLPCFKKNDYYAQCLEECPMDWNCTRLDNHTASSQE